MKEKVLLVGARATGKSAVGGVLARRLAWPFADLDQRIEAAAGRSIAEIVAAEGWEGFRRREAALLAELLEAPGRLVLAGGGGVVLHASLRELARRRALVVWLKAGVETVLRRLAADPGTGRRRPALVAGASPEAEVRRVLAERAPLYAAWAHAEVDTEGSGPEEIADRIAAMIRPPGREEG
ncbi:shikimate kinase [Dissulfurirhabdus thermomarina]|uniref:Shikimate kinase n=1 Tax=Dissulfurirhabdus thermomarina TaxID=1765737 RepID=A0A6N9TRQ9_DISTH|nr:shikimate kinase [Dissulfurirhabdus thermomarina]NDY42803.1 shikimate kinase [Dissulfurirhabdus thermomarina]NMX24389.1 shikimate kinase [Dissulfurirhabdus thermomarina]